MGKELGTQIGTVLDVGLYEFPENARIIKVKILFNVINPIRAGIFIGNDDDDGINWVDFRFENLPMFCFGCGLIRYNQENCKNTPMTIEGGTNPRGAWLRTEAMGRIYKRQEKTLRSNPRKSLSGGQFNYIPKGLIHQMAAMKIRKQGAQST